MAQLTVIFTVKLLTRASISRLERCFELLFRAVEVLLMRLARDGGNCLYIGM